jgi:hypothetical protein
MEEVVVELFWKKSRMIYRSISIINVQIQQIALDENILKGGFSGT